MSKKSSTVDREEAQDSQKTPSRQEIEAALARLQKIAEELPHVDVVEIVREGRNTTSSN